jgi:hypothetical protein
VEPATGLARWGGRSINPRSASLAVLILALAGCSGTGASDLPLSSPGSSGEQSGPSASPDFGSIDHPTGATDVVLRFEEGGGFVMPAFLATQAPAFTLYGDGTIVFRNVAGESLEPVGSVFPSLPYRTAKLTEEQVQDLLTFALGESGLGVARPDYPNDQIADASTAVFTVNAGGLKKAVSIYALGLEMEGMADGPARAAFKKLAERLQTIDAGGTIAAEPYVPAQYRGILLEGQPGVPDAKPWPWTDIAPADFVSNADPNAFQMPERLMSPDEVEALGITPFEGGFQGLTLIGPDDGRVYSFSLRPLLPDETD